MHVPVKHPTQSWRAIQRCHTTGHRIGGPCRRVRHLGGRVKEDSISTQEINQRGRTAWACVRIIIERQTTTPWRLSIRRTEETAYATTPPITPGSSWKDSPWTPASFPQNSENGEVSFATENVRLV